jgi:hypothetical protein
MRMLTIHQHAQRSGRKGGRNGNYRAIVLCPDHLCKKRKAKLEQTIPGVKVTLFDVAGKGWNARSVMREPWADRGSCGPSLGMHKTFTRNAFTWPRT